MAMINFDEYTYKNTDGRVNIKYIRDEESRLNPWEITNFVSRISTYMYKIELINTIALAINNGVEPKNIFILDKAYKINGIYSDFTEIKLNSLALNKIYSIGKPESMEPNKELMEVKFLFKLLYRINKVLYKYGKKRVGTQDRLDSYNEMKQKNFIDAISFVSELAKNKLNAEEVIFASKTIENECRKIGVEYKEYVNEIGQISYLKSILDGNKISDITEEERKIERVYYRKFYDFLIKLPRPVVGIFSSEENKVNILCADHFDSSINRNTKIELRAITHNSPIMAELEAGFEIIALKKREKREEEIHELEKQKRQQEMLKNDLDIINKAIEMKRNLDDLANTQENQGIKNMATSYIKKQLCDVYGKTQNGYENVLNTNKFHEDSFNIIDLKV